MAVLAGSGGSNVTIRRLDGSACDHRSADRRAGQGGTAAQGRDRPERHHSRLCTSCRVRPPRPGPWWGTVTGSTMPD